MAYIGPAVGPATLFVNKAGVGRIKPCKARRSIESAPVGAELLRDFELTQVTGNSLLTALGGKESAVAVMRCTLPIKNTQYGHPGVTTRFYDEEGMRKFKCDAYLCTTRWGAVVKVSISGTHVGDGRGGLGSNAVLNVELTPASLIDSQAVTGVHLQQQLVAPKRMLSSRLSGPPKHVRTIAERLATAAKRAMVNATAATAASSSTSAAVFGGQRQTAPTVNGTDDSSEAEAAAASARLRAAGLAALTATVADAAAADAARTAGIGAMFDRYGESLMSNYETVVWSDRYNSRVAPLAAAFVTECTLESSNSDDIDSWIF